MIKQGQAILLIALIGFAGLGIAFQGWRARGPDADVVSSMVRAVALVERGYIPRRGNLTDHNSVRPPGSTWLAVPGVVMFSDPRLVELGSAGLLYLLTLPGVFLLGRHYFGTAAGLLATAIFAFSAIAIFLAGNLLPKAYPVSAVWMMYFAAQWIARRNAWWLAAALVTLAAGTYVHVEMVVFILVLPALWWTFRPPVTAGAVALAATVSLVMWLPYLSYQTERSFVDMESQFLSRKIELRGDEAIAGCGEEPVPNPRFVPPPRLNASLLSERFGSIADMTLMNVETRVLGGEFILLGLLLGGLVTAFAGSAPFPRLDPRRRSLSPAAVATLAISIAVTEFVLRWGVAPDSAAATVLVGLRRLHVWLMLAGAVALARDARILTKVAELKSAWHRALEVRGLSLGIVIPSIVFLVLSEAGVTRMLGVWPLQVILIAGFLIACLSGRSVPRRWWLLAPLVVMIAAANLPVLQRVRDWRVHGWSGVEPAMVASLDFRTVRCGDERP